VAVSLSVPLLVGVSVMVTVAVPPSAAKYQEPAA
jgi:hypothetical protein